MDYLSEFVKNSTPYLAGEQPQGRAFVKLNTNENPYPPAPAVLEAIAGVEGEALRKYPDPDARAVCLAVAKRKGVSSEEVFVGNGSDEVLAFTFPTLFDRGNHAAIPAVTYSFYPVFARFFGVEVDLVPMKEDLGIDLEGLLNTGAKGIYLCNPNAPTGMEISYERLEGFLEEARKRGKAVVVDQAYAPFGETDAAPLIARYDNLLVVETLSKGYSLAGLRLGYAMGQKSWIEGLKRMRNCFNSYPVDALAQAAGVAALESEDYYRAATKQIVAERERLFDALSARGLSAPKSASNFLFVRVTEGERIYRTLKERGVLVRYFPAFPDRIRVTVGTKAQNDRLLEELDGCL